MSNTKPSEEVVLNTSESIKKPKSIPTDMNKAVKKLYAKKPDAIKDIVWEDVRVPEGYPDHEIRVIINGIDFVIPKGKVTSVPSFMAVHANAKLDQKY